MGDEKRSDGLSPRRGRRQGARDNAERIADNLKAVYDSFVAEPVPDRLLDLLNRVPDPDESKEA